MLKEERFHYILNKLHTNQKVLSSELSAELNVSEDTIRRDLNELSQNGRLRKVHGGALPPSPALPSYKERESYAQQSKVEIAQKAVKLIKDGQIVILDGGTTTLQIAHLLPAQLRITVFTNSLPIALLLAEHPQVEVIVAGGKFYKRSQVTMGLETIETFRNVRADICFLGICSIHYEIGLSVPEREEAQVKRSMIAASAQVVALATTEKMGTAEAYVVEGLQALDVLITDMAPGNEILNLYRDKGVEVL